MGVVPAMLDEGPRLTPTAGPDGQLAYSSAAVCHLVGVTYRRLDWWARTGLIPDSAPGSGTARTFTAGEVDLIRLGKHLIDAGFTIHAAFDIAQQVLERDAWSMTVADIFTLSVVTNPPPSKETP